MSRPADQLVRKLCAPRVARLRSRVRRPRLVVQSLEDRATPALLTVTSLADDGTAGTLRDAIGQANATTAADEIVFDPTLFGGGPATLALTQGEMVVASGGGNLTITGPGAATLTVDAGGASRALRSDSPLLTLTGFTVTNGLVSDSAGGGLFASGNVVVDRMAFTNNTALAPGGTGFLLGSGGGIAMTANSGLTVRNSTISGNTAEQNGGGIYFFYNGAFLILNSTVSGNTTLEAADGKSGAGIYAYGYFPTFDVINTTVANNTSASSGGGIGLKAINGVVNIVNSTIVGNSAPNANAGQGGGGIVTHDTPYITSAAPINITNTIISGNTVAAASNGPDLLTPLTVTVNFSALQDPTNGFTLSGGTGNLTGTPGALGLGTLGNNGGQVQTMVPAGGSSLVDAGDNAAVPGGVTNDARGRGFVRVYGADVDIGAVEVQPPGLPFAYSDTADVTAETFTPFQFTVAFEDTNGANNGIQAADLFNDNNVIRVVGPNGFNQLATYVGPGTLSNGPLLTITYQITPLGGGWDGSEDGYYGIFVEPNQVRDQDNNFVPGGLAGVFGVFIPQTLVVTTTADSGPGSLREAMDKAAAIPTDDTILFDPTVFGTEQTISLQSPLAPMTAITGALTIDGPGADLLTIQRDAGAGSDFRIFNSYAPALDFSDFTISGGTGQAGAIVAFGTLALDGMAITGNTTAGFGSIYLGPNQTATIANTVISGNTSAGAGGGVFAAYASTVNLIDSTVSDNTADGPGGGFFMSSQANLTVTNSTISGNTSTHGGGMYFFSGGSLQVNGSTISGNTTTDPSEFIGGGGIYFFGGPSSPVVIQNSTIADNTSAGSGGGIMLVFFFGELDIVNSTISGNTAESTAVGTYYTYGGGGISDSNSYATIVLLNSVVSGNTNVNGPDILNGNTNYGYQYAYNSLIGSSTGFILTGGANNLDFGTDPLLGPLGDNGGPTQTMAPQSGSPLLNAGNNAFVDPSVTTDQRGLARFDPLNGIVDIGAVEAQPATVAITLADGQAATTNVADPVVFTVTFSEGVTGFDPAGIDLSGSTIGGTLTATVEPVSASVYTVTVTGGTGDGTVVASVNTGAGTNSTGFPSLPSPAPAVVSVDSTAPTVTLNQGGTQADPVNAGPIHFTVAFSEPVVGFDATDISFAGSTVAGTLSAVLTPTGGNTFDVAVSGMTGEGTVVASIPVGAVTDPAGNANPASTGSDNTVTFDAVGPAVTIGASATQPDPTSQSPIVFDLTFSEPVIGLAATDIDLSGSTAGGTLVASLTQTGPTTYTVSVTGMTSRGRVEAFVPAGAVADGAGNLSTVSNTDSVEFLNAGSVTLSAAVLTTPEGVGTLQITASRVGGNEGVVTVDFAAVAGTAQLGPDFGNTVGTLTWGEGESQDQVISIPITNDTNNEGKETFTLNLTNPTGGLLLGAVPSTAVTILHSDGAVINGAATRPAKPSAVFQDAAGLNADNVTVTLGGRLGTATVYLTDPDGDGRGPIELIELSGTDPAKSILTVGVKKPRGSTGDARTLLGEVTGSGLKALNALTTDLNGPGINLTGYLGSLKIGNVSGGADIIVNGAPPALPKNPSVKITAGIIGDGSDITIAAAPLGNLTATSVGDGTITARSAGVINAKGKPKTRLAAAIPGDFKADVVLSGVGVVDPLKNTLTRLRAAGTMTGDVTVAGNVGTISVGARGVGDLTGDVTVTGNLNVVTVAGKADGVLIDVGGNVKVASFGQFWNSRLDAGYTGPDDGSGTYTLNTLGVFKVSGKTNGFQSSNVIASTINSVTLASVNPVNVANPGTKFGVTADKALKRLVVTSPTQKFVFNPKAASPQSTAALGDFQANDRNGPLALSRVSAARVMSVAEAAEEVSAPSVVEAPAIETTAAVTTTAATAQTESLASWINYNLNAVTAPSPLANRLSNLGGVRGANTALGGSYVAAKADLLGLTHEERLARRAAAKAARQ